MKLSGSYLRYFEIVLPALILFLLPAGCAVSGEEETLITVLPESTVVTLGDTEQFSVTPAGTVVTWSVNGILGGNEGTVGTVDTTGIYTAPSDAETAPEKVSVSAVDTAGASASAVAFLTTFDANKRLTTYTAGTSRANTYSSGQKNIAVFKETVTGDINVYAVWSDNSSGSYKVYFTKSGNGGNSFDTPVPVDDTSLGEQFSPAIAVDDNGDVFIVWEDRGQGDADIFFRKYDSDAGFDTKKQINADTTGIFDYDTTPSIANSSGQIYITWEHRNYVIDDYPDIYFAWSSNLGDTFQTPKYLTLSGRRPAIAMDSSGVAYIVWEDLGEGFIQFPSLPTVIKLRKIEDGTEGASKSLEVTSGYNARYPAIAVDPVCNTSGDRICDVYVLWQRALISEPKFVSEVISSYDIDLTVVNGGTLGIIKTTLSVPDSGSSGIFGGTAYPAVAADDSNIYMVWDDWRNGIKDIYFAKSIDGSVFSTNRIVNDDASADCNFLCNEKPGIAVANGKAYVIWTDFRNTQLSTTASPNDVFFAVEQ